MGGERGRETGDGQLLSLAWHSTYRANPAARAGSFSAAESRGAYRENRFVVESRDTSTASAMLDSASSRGAGAEVPSPTAEAAAISRGSAAPSQSRTANGAALTRLATSCWLVCARRTAQKDLYSSSSVNSSRSASSSSASNSGPCGDGPQAVRGVPFSTAAKSRRAVRHRYASSRPATRGATALREAPEDLHAAYHIGSMAAAARNVRSSDTADAMVAKYVHRAAASRAPSSP